MIIWEYCHIFWKTARISPKDRGSMEQDPSWKVITLGDQTVVAKGLLHFCSSSDAPTTFTDLWGMLAELGSDGWEVVSHTYIPDPISGEKFLLKRPLAED